MPLDFFLFIVPVGRYAGTYDLMTYVHVPRSEAEIYENGQICQAEELSNIVLFLIRALFPAQKGSEYHEAYSIPVQLACRG